jgi:hypothetical protein
MGISIFFSVSLDKLPHISSKNQLEFLWSEYIFYNTDFPYETRPYDKSIKSELQITLFACHDYFTISTRFCLHTNNKQRKQKIHKPDNS